MCRYTKVKMQLYFNWLDLEAYTIIVYNKFKVLVKSMHVLQR